MTNTSELPCANCLFRYFRSPAWQFVVLRRRQQRLARLVEKIYGARFDRHTLEYLKAADGLRITDVRFLKNDTYMLIEGEKIATGQDAALKLS